MQSLFLVKYSSQSLALVTYPPSGATDLFMNAIVSSSAGPFVALLGDELCAGIRNGEHSQQRGRDRRLDPTYQVITQYEINTPTRDRLDMIEKQL